SVERLLEPVHAQPLELARGLECPLAGPARTLLGLLRTRLLRLVGVDQDHEAVAHRAAHALDLRDVLADRPVGQPPLARAPALGPPGRGALATPRAVAQLDAARVAGHAVAVAAPELPERLAGRLADQVPERDLDAPGAAGVLEDPLMALELERVLADQARLDPALERRRVGVAGRAPADQPVVARDPDQDRAAAAPVRSRRPGRPDRLGERPALQANDLEVGDLHRRVGLSLRPR